MLVNKDLAISTWQILLVPYEAHHVPIYHSWMKDEEVREATASELLSIDEEYAMQRSWRNDADKLTFIVCLPVASDSVKRSSITSQLDDSPSKMIGDINLFLTPADEDPEGCIGELELMIAPKAFRRQGYGRAALLAFLNYLQQHLQEILEEYRVSVLDKESSVEDDQRMKMRLLQLRVKIGSKNEKSIKLFQSVEFVKVGQGENYFGEVELVFEGFLGKERVKGLLDRWNVMDYGELKYCRPNE